jgi:glutamine amidotransferase
MNTISIIDYGVGNLLSVARAFEYFSVEVKLVKTAEEILSADRLVLPGVGAFSNGMQALLQSELVEPIKAYTKKGNPFLGICLGMQMMLTESCEFGAHKGLDLISGKVVAVPPKTSKNQSHKIPHIGWNELRADNPSYVWDNTILKSLPDRPPVYFVHSFMGVTTEKQHQLAYVYYGGQEVCAAIKKDNIYGCQFHPEKSGPIGLKIIENFIALQ